MSCKAGEGGVPAWDMARGLIQNEK
jgi:hypothetical protein